MSELTPEENATFEELAERVTNMKVEHLSGEEAVEAMKSFIDQLGPAERAQLLDFFEQTLKDFMGGHND